VIARYLLRSCTKTRGEIDYKCVASGLPNRALHQIFKEIGGEVSEFFARLWKLNISMTIELNEVAGELDRLHSSAKEAYAARDISSYQEYFTADLVYIQADGKSIGREQLMRDISKQIKQHKAVDSTMNRESIEINDDGTITQVVQHRGSYSVSVFYLFTKKWKLERKGVYTYRKTENGWRICSVEVLSETISSFK